MCIHGFWLVTQSIPAALYMFTSDSLFNNVDMINYIAHGTVIRLPGWASSLLGSGMGNSSLMDVDDTFNDTAGWVAIPAEEVEGGTNSTSQ